MVTFDLLRIAKSGKYKCDALPLRHGILFARKCLYKLFKTNQIGPPLAHALLLRALNVQPSRSVVFKYKVILYKY